MHKHHTRTGKFLFLITIPIAILAVFVLVIDESQGLTNQEKNHQAISSTELFIIEQVAPTAEGKYLQILKNPSNQNIPMGGDAEFTIIILNTSDKVDLIDVTVVDPLVPDCDRNIGNLAANTNFPPYKCTLKNVQNAFRSEITVTGKNALNRKPDSASDTAQVNLYGMKVNLDPDPGSVVEPGGVVSFTLNISNTGNLDLDIISLESEPFGDLTNQKNPSIISNNCLPDPTLPKLLAGIGTSTCTFSASLSGQPGEEQISVEATAEWNEGQPFKESGKTLIEIIDSPASISTSLSANPSDVPVPLSNVIFTARIENTSLVDEVSINNLNDSVIGNLDGNGSCSLPQILASGETYQCQYIRELSGEIGERMVIKLSASGEDDDNPPGQVSAEDQQEINFVKPRIFSLFLPIASQTVDEPNNTCREAYPIELNQVHWFMANDREDWYVFELGEPRNIRVELTNYKPLLGQIVIYKGNECGSLSIVKNNGNDKETKLIDLGLQQPSRYYARVHTDGLFNDRNPYKLVITDQ